MKMEPEDYYKEQYFYEIARRDTLLDELNLPYGLLAGLLAALTNLIDKSVEPLKSGSHSASLLLVVIVISGVALIMAGWFLWNSWAEKKNYYPATASGIKKYGDELIEFYKSSNSASSIDDAKKKLSGFILEEYVRCASKNAGSNLIRANNLKWAKRALLAAGVFVTIGYIVSSLDKVDMATNENSNSSNQGGAASTPSTPSGGGGGSGSGGSTGGNTGTTTQPVEPTPPAGRVIKDAPR